MIKSIPKLNRMNFVEWTRLCHDILQIFWHFLGKKYLDSIDQNLSQEVGVEKER